MSMPMTPDEIVLDDLFENPGSSLRPPPSPRRKGKDRDMRRGSGAGTGDGEVPAGLSRLFSVPRASARLPQPLPVRLTPLRDDSTPSTSNVVESHAEAKVAVGGAG